MDKSLKEVQREFVEALLHPAAGQRVLDTLVGEDTHNQNRLALYRGNLTGTWHSVLASAYPVVHALVGEDFFVALSREYGLADPSSSGDLNQFGHRMADLLTSWPPSAPYRYLADIARLEWAVHQAYFAADVFPWSVERWARHAPHVLEAAAISLNPAVALLRTSTSAADMWIAYQESGSESVVHDIEAPQWIVVSRPQWIPKVQAVTPAAFEMLEALRLGESLGAALDIALTVDGNFDFGATWRSWIEQKIVVAAVFK
ncbi:MAG: putative DNA-binding domain-containing protein [Burkholderiales bacterium]|nr:putative DNA-binding domain-containing protein [Burkholderiales bacterium]